MKINPIIVHYHIYPGGVSQSILNCMVSLVKHGMIKSEICILVGDDNRSKWFVDEFREEVGEGVDIKVECLPELFFWKEPYPAMNASVRAIKQVLEKKKGEDNIIWCHNPTIGLNPALPAALKEFALENPDQKIWMHIHDLAEEGRWDLLEFLRKHYKESYYFLTPGTRWITINIDLHKKFASSDMPDDYVYYLPNAIILPTGDIKVQGPEISVKISEYAKKNNFTFRPDLRRMLFAGRTIRRKNLLEAVLIARCAKEPTTLLVTLPADVERDRQYQGIVFKALRENVSAVAGFGIEQVGTDYSLRELFNFCDQTLISSVMEGFGLPYLESSIMKRPLLAKYIKVLDDFKQIGQTMVHRYYNHLDVPAPSSVKEDHIKNYRKKINSLRRRFNISESAVKQWKDYFTKIFSQEYVPFGYLSVEGQSRILGQTRDRGMVGAIQAKNPDLLTKLEKGFNDDSADNDEILSVIDERFGPRTNFRIIRSILDSYGQASQINFDEKDFSQRILDSYFIPPSLRLLLD
jgi:hypothetical protein